MKNKGFIVLALAIAMISGCVTEDVERVSTTTTVPLITAEIGDTVYAKMLVSEKKESKSKPDQGTITFGLSVCNHKDETVQEGQWVALMARR